MRSWIVAAAMSLAVTGAAAAADMSMPVKAPAPAPVELPFSWTGFYIGVNAGGHWGNDNDPAYISYNNNFIPGNVTLLNQLAPATLRPSGFAGGGHAGYNWQTGTIVLGVEGDIVGLTGTANRNINTPIIVDTAQFNDSVRDQWMSTVRARLGLAADHWLFYVTGGVAFSEWSINHAFSSNGGGPGAPNGSYSGNVFRVGGTVGGGIEYAATRNILLRAEYLWAGFGTSTSAVNGAVSTFNTQFTHPDRLSENVARVGISYLFGAQ